MKFYFVKLKYKVKGKLNLFLIGEILITDFYALSVWCLVYLFLPLHWRAERGVLRERKPGRNAFSSCCAEGQTEDPVGSVSIVLLAWYPECCTFCTHGTLASSWLHVSLVVWPEPQDSECEEILPDSPLGVHSSQLLWSNGFLTLSGSWRSGDFKDPFQSKMHIRICTKNLQTTSEDL